MEIDRIGRDMKSGTAEAPDRPWHMGGRGDEQPVFRGVRLDEPSGLDGVLGGGARHCFENDARRIETDIAYFHFRGILIAPPAINEPRVRKNPAQPREFRNPMRAVAAEGDDAVERRLWRRLPCREPGFERHEEPRADRHDTGKYKQARQRRR